MRPYVNITFPGQDRDRDNAKILKAINLLLRVGEENMTAISYFAAAQQAFQQRMDAAITAISEDIAALNEQIAVLQNSGTISDADQLLLNELHTRTEDIATKLERVDAMKGEAPTPPAG